MSHLIHGEYKYGELNRENDYRPYLLGDARSTGYRFGRFNGGHVRTSVRGAVRGIARALRFMHEAMLAAHMRRVERELSIAPRSERHEAIRRGLGT